MMLSTPSSVWLLLPHRLSYRFHRGLVRKSPHTIREIIAARVRQVVGATVVVVLETGSPK